jgi:protein tyrosine phosphatase (PTP) superfamily phosphohydrolase (DUF442 family)
LALTVGLGMLVFLVWHRDDWVEKRVRVIVAGRLVRGAWQRPGPLRHVIAREGIKTIVTLTAINSTDSKFLDQQQVVKEMGIDWVIIPMRGSRATAEQMALAADILADSRRQPVFFHCVAGHHRTSLAHAAYLIRHEGRTAEQAWQAISQLPWARPDSVVDRNDRFLIEEFARVQRSLKPLPERGAWEVGYGSWSRSTAPVVCEAGDSDRGSSASVGLLEPVDLQLRGSGPRTALPVRTDAPRGTHANTPKTQD